jgi:hypothetical protein
MAFIVQQNDYQDQNIIGLFESLDDALICSTTEEALTDIPCKVFYMDIQSSYVGESLDNIKIKKNIAKEEAKIYREKQRLQEIDQSITDFCNAGGQEFYDNLLLKLNDQKYLNLVSKLVNREITLEECKAKQSEISKEIDKFLEYAKILYENTNA